VKLIQISMFLFQCYKRILQIEPGNVQGLHNLCVVYVERGNLVRAEACLRHTLRLAPHEEYVSRHLKIVQARLAKLTEQEVLEQRAHRDPDYEGFISALPFPTEANETKSATEATTS
jgi:thioredoxin-like negative regulator of GroEL